MNGESTVTRVRFKPLMDWWVAILVSILVLVFVMMIVLMSLRVHQMSSLLIIIGGIILTILYIVDKAFFTSYLLLNDGLVISNQFMEVQIPYRDMRSLRHGSVFSLWSLGKHKRFALSARNIILDLNDGAWRTISLSPHKEQDFINQILKNIDTDRTLRTSKMKHG